MFLFRRPPPHALGRFVEQSRGLPLSYAAVGIARTSPERYDVDETVVSIGHGEACFERAKAALVAWKHFGIGWVEVWPRSASVEPGTAVAVLIRHLGFWSLNGCRVLYGLGDRAHGPSFGCAYGTLTNRAEQGEEMFEVLLRPGTHEVEYRIGAVSRPRAPLARLGYPAARLLQAQFRRDSAEAMRLATTGRDGGAVDRRPPPNLSPAGPSPTA